MIVTRAGVEGVSHLRFLEDFIADVEDECLIAGFSVSKAEILVAILRDVEEIAHKEFGDGPSFLTEAAAERRAFRQQNAVPLQEHAPLREHAIVVRASRDRG